jgi:hypothetical protein
VGEEPVPPTRAKRIGQHEEPTIAKHPAHLVQALSLVGPVVEAEGRQDHVEVGVGEGELLGGGVKELDAAIGSCVGLADHARSGVHPDKLGVGVPGSHAAEQLPGAAAHVECGVELTRFSGRFGDRGLLDWAEEEALWD